MRMVEGHLNMIWMYELCIERRWFKYGERKLISTVG
jgi:hypothetical protein